jgi:hypothetical protein
MTMPQQEQYVQVVIMVVKQLELLNLLVIKQIRANVVIATL